MPLAWFWLWFCLVRLCVGWQVMRSIAPVAQHRADTQHTFAHLLNRTHSCRKAQDKNWLPIAPSQAPRLRSRGHRAVVARRPSLTIHTLPKHRRLPTHECTRARHVCVSSSSQAAGNWGKKFSEYHVLHLFTSTSSLPWKTGIALAAITPHHSTQFSADAGRHQADGNSTRDFRQHSQTNNGSDHCLLKVSRMFSLFSIKRRVSEMKTTESWMEISNFYYGSF